MITLLHGGQTGVDRGAHDGALANQWDVTGFMPSDARDELGPIPPEVAQKLHPNDNPGYSARTEANIHWASAVLVIVPDVDNPRATPGTAMTLDCARKRKKPCRIVSPASNLAPIAHWLWANILWQCPAMLPIAGFESEPVRLMIAGPRESKWPGAQKATADLLRKLALATARIKLPSISQDLVHDPE